MRSRDYTKKNKKVPTTSRLYKIGDRVYGIRSPNAYVGELVETYATLNNGYKNYAYRIKCDTDGKLRSFQLCSSIDNKDNIEGKYTIK